MAGSGSGVFVAGTAVSRAVGVATAVWVAAATSVAGKAVGAGVVLSAPPQPMSITVKISVRGK